MEVKPKHIYEIGSGSGYQAAILAQLVEDVVSVERIRPLLEKAKQRCRMLKLFNIRFDFTDGLSNSIAGPFDGILVAAAPTQIPDYLVALLSIGGRLVMPVGSNDHQELVVIDKSETGIEKRIIEVVKFVPLVSGTVK